MKYLIFLTILTGCATRDYKEYTRQVAEYGVQTIKVEDHTCVVYRDQDTSLMQCWKKEK